MRNDGIGEGEVSDGRSAWWPKCVMAGVSGGEASGGEASGSEVSEAWVGVGEDEMSEAGWEKVMHG